MPVGGDSLLFLNHDGPGLGNLLALYEAPSPGGFRGVENVKIWFLCHNFMASVGSATNT